MALVTIVPSSSYTYCPSCDVFRHFRPTGERGVYEGLPSVTVRCSHPQCGCELIIVPLQSPEPFVSHNPEADTQ